MEKNKMKTQNTENQKKIIIFGITGVPVAGSMQEVQPYLIMLATEMNKYAKKHDFNVLIDVASTGHMDSVGKEADIILLAPDAYKLESEAQQMYPGKVVKVMDKQDYGLMDADKIFQKVLDE